MKTVAQTFLPQYQSPPPFCVRGGGGGGEPSVPNFEKEGGSEKISA